MSAAAAIAASDSHVAPVHTISILVRNKPGVLVRVALVFSRRGYNIDSLVVSTDVANGDFSRMTITCSGDPQTLEHFLDGSPARTVLRIRNGFRFLERLFERLGRADVRPGRAR